jgi:hypothetical protein
MIIEMSHFVTVTHKIVNYDNIMPTTMTHLDTKCYSCYNSDRLTVDVATSAARGLIHRPLPLHLHSRPVAACPCSRPCENGSGSQAPWSRLGPRCRVCRTLAFLMQPNESRAPRNFSAGRDTCHASHHGALMLPMTPP